MGYRNDQTERARLHKVWITDEDRPCAECGSRYDREIAHKDGNGWAECQETNKETCRVLCYTCHQAEHPHSKFMVGDKVRLRNDGDRKHGTPDELGFTDYELSRPRTIISIRYDRAKQANLYRLGSNGKGKMLDGQPLDGFDYWFRSYQLIPYIPRNYHFKRGYTMQNTDTRLSSTTSGGNRLGNGNKVQAMPASQLRI